MKTITARLRKRLIFGVTAASIVAIAGLAAVPIRVVWINLTLSFRSVAALFAAKLASALAASSASPRVSVRRFHETSAVVIANTSTTKPR